MADSIQYITNDKNERVALIIPIKEFEGMLAEIGLTPEDYEKRVFWSAQKRSRSAA